MPTSAKSGLWIVIGDIHDKTANLKRIPELGEASEVLISGDLTNCGGLKDGERIMADIGDTSGLPVYAQIGNMDLAPINEYLDQTHKNLHCKLHELTPDLAVIGIGGSTITPMHTPSEFTEDDYRKWLAELWPKAEKYPHLVLISHNPPKDTLCDDIGGGVHVGSVAVREFIEQKKPEACICGHIHEGRAVDKIGETIVINPGQLSEGGYVVLKLDNGKLKADMRQVAN